MLGIKSNRNSKKLEIGSNRKLDPNFIKFHSSAPVNNEYHQSAKTVVLFRNNILEVSLFPGASR